MYPGVAFIEIVFQLAMLIGIVVFAVKLPNRLQELSDAQKVSSSFAG